MGYVLYSICLAALLLGNGCSSPPPSRVSYDGAIEYAQKQTAPWLQWASKLPPDVLGNAIAARAQIQTAAHSTGQCPLLVYGYSFPHEERPDCLQLSFFSVDYSMAVNTIVIAARNHDQRTIFLYFEFPKEEPHVQMVNSVGDFLVEELSWEEIAAKAARVEEDACTHRVVFHFTRLPATAGRNVKRYVVVGPTLYLPKGFSKDMAVAVANGAGCMSNFVPVRYYASKKAWLDVIGDGCEPQKVE